MGFQAYFVSDLHLKTQEEKNAQIFVRFLRRILDEEKTTHLFLVGDVFDFWVSDHTHFIEKFSTIVGSIELLVKKGIEVHYFEGNHDLHLERFWTRKMGINVYQEPSYFPLGERIVRVEHGDLIDPEDKGYLFLKSVLQTKAAKYFFDHAYEGIVTKIGETASKTSRKYTTEQKKITEEAVTKKHREHAHRAFDERPFDLIVTGHIHFKDDYEFTEEDQSVRAVNLGTWMDEPIAYILSDTEEGFRQLL